MAMNNPMTAVLFFLLFFASDANDAQASGLSCINPPASGNTLLRESYDTSWSDLKLEFLTDKFKTNPDGKAKVDNLACRRSSVGLAIDLRKVIGNEDNQMVDVPDENNDPNNSRTPIKKECVSASLQRFPALKVMPVSMKN
jgi:hypothetical protein